ncbi:DUF4129 domain-containing transglutaminase family protein [Methylogaea oryzae]|uniref:DUF4129 domain-containing transglutaminase family protein n=1 Tax=Methylogaea oryzae TaxID=1295382 RepID=UPI00138F598D|nr:transglutaminase domain-containing protein [Methylogaea oryzae]
MAYFHDNDFHYTLHPPLLTERPVERFLLETRRGFCEHYATSFAVLMRLAGIPARVVTGYQGGLWNDVGEFLEVRQSDAHAWAEVWLNGSGWVRVDPTAAVAPERVERPVVAEVVSVDGGRGVESDSNGFSLAPWVLPAKTLWANVDHGWHRWVLGYDHNAREKALQWLNGGHWPKTLGWLSLALLGVSAPFAWSLWRSERLQTRDPALRSYQRFCKKLDRLGLPRRSSEGPQAYAARIARHLPRLASQAHEITDIYLRLRYGGESGSGLLEALRIKVRRLK